jgi:RimJ/RimL family protein N-acetyltransferase
VEVWGWGYGFFLLKTAFRAGGLAESVVLRVEEVHRSILLRRVVIICKAENERTRNVGTSVVSQKFVA